MQLLPLPLLVFLLVRSASSETGTLHCLTGSTGRGIRIGSVAAPGSAADYSCVSYCRTCTAGAPGVCAKPGMVGCCAVGRVETVFGAESKQSLSSNSRPGLYQCDEADDCNSFATAPDCQAAAAAALLGASKPQPRPQPKAALTCFASPGHAVTAAAGSGAFVCAQYCEASPPTSAASAASGPGSGSAASAALAPMPVQALVSLQAAAKMRAAPDVWPGLQTCATDRCNTGEGLDCAARSSGAGARVGVGEGLQGGLGDGLESASGRLRGAAASLQQQLERQDD